ncbi:DUF2460 domain-containing protein [Anabaena catenula]|uniref:DUF2460 domain-containing protein n=1 Tax=Anabaena catenula FACHB-362 TaxID=2692877 RepID=A0ABR8JC46_9NOST|nr:DUF2460 domain-containing protein [Anabaena catenula]MBD2694436.1 DUF2460 domain-containing protein [Anabaena catenula FACHB-362]
MSFNETRLNLGFDFGTVGGASFSTTVLTTGGGYEQRNSNWDEPRGRWQIGDRLYNREELDYIIRFHRAHRGKAVGFRFRDWANYQAENELIGVGDGVTTQFQLKKTYTVGSQSTVQTIKKPVVGSVYLTVAGEPIVSGFSVDYTTGLCTFTAPPTGNINATFDFDIPVRFEQDLFDHRYDAGTQEEVLFYVSTLAVLEIKI